ncbi:hypothetical protein ACJDU8_01810 [Clostridium sp. WILCCON 0269]|uniref:Lipoprotein n=1 Tax=Candidatus Clostridium eludens TaxID=3381663 RepID=A0ABW8SGG8_9CLOT
MKKVFFTFIVLTISIFFVACSAKTSNNTSNVSKPNTTKSNAARNTTNTKITYTKELSYIPAYNSDMKAVSTAPPNSSGLTTANYTIKNSTNTEVLQNYENIFKQDGWTITQDQKKSNSLMGFVSKKDTHQATVVILQNNKDVAIVIKSK